MHQVGVPKNGNAVPDFESDGELTTIETVSLLVKNYV
jgi:hypothetical protein